MHNEKTRKFLKEWVIPFAIEITVIFLLIQFVFFLVRVPTGSMLPTIEEGGWLFATRMHNPEKSVQRGDIVVFHSEETESVLIKRCIGLPGEHVDVSEDGIVAVNGTVLDEPYVVYASGWTNGATFDVPEGCYLFFGDNRAGSEDARHWMNPYIPASEIKGKAHFTLWPANLFGPLQ